MNFDGHESFASADAEDRRTSSLWSGAATGVVGIGIVAAVAFAVGGGVGWLERHLAHVRELRLALLAGGAAAFLLVLTLAAWLRAHGAARWPSVVGVVTSSEVRERESDQMGSQQRFLRVYYPHVAYDYEVATQRYAGEQLEFGARAGAGDRDRARRHAERYRVGAPVRVHYDPAHPERSYLEAPSALWVFALASAVLWAVALYQAGVF